MDSISINKNDDEQSDMYMEQLAALMEYCYNAKGSSVNGNEIVVKGSTMLVNVTKLNEPIDDRIWRFRVTSVVFENNKEIPWAMELFASDNGGIEDHIRACRIYEGHVLWMLTQEYKKLLNEKK